MTEEQPKKKKNLSEEDLKAWQEAMRGTKSIQSKKESKSEEKKSRQKTTESYVKSKLTEEDLSLWQSFTQKITPLDEAKKIQKEEIPSLEKQENLTATEVSHKPIKTPLSKEHLPQPTSLPPLSLYHAIGIDKKTYARLKRGRIPFEDTLDFHGISFSEARYHLIQKINDWYERGIRCTLIITGRGARTPKEQESIKNAFPQWLNESPNREKLLAFTKAQPRHGGEGAFYLLLKRKK